MRVQESVGKRARRMFKFIYDLSLAVEEMISGYCGMLNTVTVHCNGWDGKGHILTCVKLSTTRSVV
jgi:hypothetical protein